MGLQKTIYFSVDPKNELAELPKFWSPILRDAIYIYSAKKINASNGTLSDEIGLAQPLFPTLKH